MDHAQEQSFACIGQLVCCSAVAVTFCSCAVSERIGQLQLQFDFRFTCDEQFNDANACLLAATNASLQIVLGSSTGDQLPTGRGN